MQAHNQIQSAMPTVPPKLVKVRPYRFLLYMGRFLIALTLPVFFGSLIAFGGRTEEVIIKAPPAPTPVPVDAPGVERHPKDPTRCVVEHGHQICDQADGAEILKFYQASKGTLGRPLTEYDGRSQVFDNFVLRFNSGETNPEWKLQPENLGQTDLSAHGGRTPMSGATTNPLLAQYLVNKARDGVDITKLFGPTIWSPADCPPQDQRHRCYQWTVKAKFSWPADAQSSAQVELEPLGKLTLPQQVPPIQEEDKKIYPVIPWERNYPLLGGIGISVFSLGLGLHMLRTRKQRRARQQKRRREQINELNKRAQEEAQLNAAIQAQQAAEAAANQPRYRR